jgi:hypothetical protein
MLQRFKLDETIVDRNLGAEISKKSLKVLRDKSLVDRSGACRSTPFHRGRILLQSELTKDDNEVDKKTELRFKLR